MEDFMVSQDMDTMRTTRSMGRRPIDPRWPGHGSARTGL
jgi:hypothetical protein